MNERSFLTIAIIAFDLMIKECIENDRNGREFHPCAVYILKMLKNLIPNPPELNRLQEQYILNISEISSDIKNIFLLAAPKDEDLINMLKIQADRLEWLNDKTNKPNHNMH